MVKCPTCKIDYNEEPEKCDKCGYPFSGTDKERAYFIAHHVMNRVDKTSVAEDDKDSDEPIEIPKELDKDKLLRAHKTAKKINWYSGAIFLWIVFFPEPYKLVMNFTLIFVIVIMIRVKFSKGLIRVFRRKNRIYPSINNGFAFLILGLLTRAIYDYHILRYLNVWLPAVVIAIVLLFFLLIDQKEITGEGRSDIKVILRLCLYLLAYGYSVVIYINCNFDYSETQYSVVKVLDKEISGNSPNHHLKFTPWKQNRKISDLIVSEELYNRVEIDDQLHIYFKEGKFGIPWFVLTDQKREAPVNLFEKMYYPLEIR